MWWLCAGQTITCKLSNHSLKQVTFYRQGLAHLLDRVADHYSFSPLPAYNNNNKASNSTESDSDSGFVSPASVVLPLARFSSYTNCHFHSGLDSVINIPSRLLPILTAVLEEDGGEPWLNHLQVTIVGISHTNNSHSEFLKKKKIFSHSGESFSSAPGSKCV